MRVIYFGFVSTDAVDYIKIQDEQGKLYYLFTDIWIEWVSFVNIINNLENN